MERVSSDLDKGVTFGDADGPDLFINQLGIVVPTFSDPRNDLIIGTAQYFARVSHHIPFKCRGFFTPGDWPEQYRASVDYKIDAEGFVLCAGVRTYGKDAGKLCRAKAVNRTRFCRCHGGGLHPLDKKMSAKSVMAPPENRVKALDRPQKFLQGFLDISDLTDEEVQGLFIYNDNGQKVESIALGVKMHGQIAQELHRRMNRFLQTKTASMLNVMVDIAESELVEPADRIKAATWVAERVLGKTPEVIMHGKVEAPYEAIFDTIDAGSRSDYRQEVGGSKLELGGSGSTILDVEFDDSEGNDDGFDSQDQGSDFEEEKDSGSESTGLDGQDESVESALRAAEELGQRKEEADRQKEIKKARAKAKQRRFAARAVGATTVHDMPWAVEWKFRADGTFKMKLVCPDEQTQARLDKIAFNNDVADKAAEQWRSGNVA